jgi:transposase
MPRCYSLDLRQKIIDAIERDGLKKSEASELFHVSRNTIDLWLKRREATGSLAPKAYRPSGGTHKITDWQAFQAFAEEHGDKTQAQMAELWPEPISSRSISRALAKLGFTRKKNIWVPRTRRAATSGVHRAVGGN